MFTEKLPIVDCHDFIDPGNLKENVLRLAKIHEKDGKTDEAAKIMQELQVSCSSCISDGIISSGYLAVHIVISTTLEHLFV